MTQKQQKSRKTRWSVRMWQIKYSSRGMLSWEWHCPKQSSERKESILRVLRDFPPCSLSSSLQACCEMVSMLFQGSNSYKNKSLVRTEFIMVSKGTRNNYVLSFIRNLSISFCVVHSEHVWTCRCLHLINSMIILRGERAGAGTRLPRIPSVRFLGLMPCILIPQNSTTKTKIKSKVKLQKHATGPMQANRK